VGRPIAAFASIFVAIVAGCQAFLVFVPENPPGGDGGASEDGSAMVDGPTATIPESGADAGSPTDAGPLLPACPSLLPDATVFCDDFEQGTLARWSSHDDAATNFATVVADPTADAAGVPVSNLSLLSQLTRGACFYAVARKNFEGAYEHLRIAFRLLLAQDSGLEDDIVASAELRGDVDRCAVNIVVKRNATFETYAVRVEEQVGPIGQPTVEGVHSTSGSLPRDRFAVVDLEADFASSRVILMIDQAKVLDAQLVACPIRPAPARAAFGLSCAVTGSGAAHVHLDDAVFEAR
jgi:hypothetical protein